MKKKIIVNSQKLTREANLFPVERKKEDLIFFKPQAKNHCVEKLNGYWKINFKDKK